MAAEVDASVAELIDGVLRRRSRDLTQQELAQLGEVLAVACPERDERHPVSCGVAAGYECRNLVDDTLLLRRLLFHDARRRRAGVAQLPSSAIPVQDRGPKRRSETEAAERRRRASGRAYPGWESDQSRWADR